MKELNWKTLRNIYLGTYDGEPINAKIGNAVIKESRLEWINGTSEGVMDSWFDKYCCPPREYRFDFVSDDDGFIYSGYSSVEGYFNWIGRHLSDAEIESIINKEVYYGN